MGWLIALGILALLTLILMLRIGIKIKLADDTLLWLGVGIFRIKLYPRREKTVRLSDYKIEKFRKNQAKKEAKAKKKSDKKSEKKKTSKVSQALQTKPKEKRDISELLETVLEIVKVFLERFGRHLHIKVKRLRIIVASMDAATTAVLYGAVCGTVQCILELLDNTVSLVVPKNEEIVVAPDFISTKTKADVDIAFSLRIWQIFDIAIRSLWAYIKQK